MASTLATTAVKSIAGPDSAAGRAIDRLPPALTNVSSAERWASLAAGACLIAAGPRKGLGGLLSVLGGTMLLNRAATGHCGVYQLMKVSTSDATADQSVIAAGHGTKVEVSAVIGRPPAQVYRFWRRLANLPRFMSHITAVREDGATSHWTATGPLGLVFEWDAEITADEPGRLIAWRSVRGADIDTAGSVHFVKAAGDRGTEVRVSLKYDPPAGQVGTLLARLLGHSPEAVVRADLARLKELMESNAANKAA